MKYTNRSLVAAFASPAPRVTTARTALMFFEGNSLYSYGYHYLLAFLQVTPEGKKNAYVNGTKYSQTTSCHRSTALSELLKAGWGIIPHDNPAAIRDGYTDRRSYEGIAALGGKPARS